MLYVFVGLLSQGIIIVFFVFSKSYFLNIRLFSLVCVFYRVNLDVLALFDDLQRMLSGGIN
jgi:hypothetical protein